MALPLLAGAALATPLGILLGNALVDRTKYGFLQGRAYIRTVDISADDDDDIPMPATAGQPVSFFKKQLLRNTSPWLVQPDYDRVLFINTILKLLWPHLSPAIHKMAMEQAKVPLEDVCKKAKVLKTIRIDKLDLGTVPPRVDCFKSFETGEDELIIETPAFWGGDISLRVTAVVQVGSQPVDVPVDVSNIQFKALTRITVKPLVETLPCLGGVTVSLMETPHFDMDLRLCDSPDIMALPGVPLLVQSAISIVAGKMLVYPNEFTLPLMPNFGLPPPPQGMLHIKVVKCTGLKGGIFDRMDPFVTLELRKGREAKTSTKTNQENPVWDEEFDLVVDEPKKQALRITVSDDDLISASKEGVAVVLLEGADFMLRPRQTVTLNVPLHRPGAEGKKAKNRAAGARTSESKAPSSAASGNGAGPASPPGSSEKKKRGILDKLHLRRKKKLPPVGEVAAEQVAAAVGGQIVSPASEGGASPRDSVAGGSPLASPRAEEGHEEEEGAAGTSTPSTPRIQLPAGAPTGAVLTLELTYLPFKSATPEPVTPSPTPGATDDADTTMVTSIRRMLTISRTPNLLAKGVLTVTLKKCTNLEDSPDTFAVMTLYDPHRKPIPSIEYRTDVVMNEDCPRYNLRKDFVNVSAASSLSVVVYEQPGTMDALASLKVPFLQKAKPKVIGRMRVLASDVVREGRIRDQWPLLEAQTGECHLSLEWNPVKLEEDPTRH